jgi:hypothetical protein
VLAAREGTTEPFAEVVCVVGGWQIGGTAFTVYLEASPQPSPKREGAKLSSI